ncbi:MAG: hypothetical protein G01um101420_235 [Parcubacteria group bacterium Gr01-1014_20]|nr:MAG: hypothetical protein G01um101420_235 [Parcubacteria group bacterium Gr01-1014_20]
MTISEKLQLTSEEKRIFGKLNSPMKIQDYLETIPINFEKRGETCMSPRLVVRGQKAHCFEGALFAAAALLFHGQNPLLLDLKTIDGDFDHVVALFRKGKFWGSISKTNHAVLRYREPVYKSVRELAMSFFHEYFLNNGKKTMRSFSNAFNLNRYQIKDWVISEKPLWFIDKDLDISPHHPIFPGRKTIELRKADPVEIRAGKLTTWS